MTSPLTAACFSGVADVVVGFEAVGQKSLYSSAAELQTVHCFSEATHSLTGISL